MEIAETGVFGHNSMDRHLIGGEIGIDRSFRFSEFPAYSANRNREFPPGKSLSEGLSLLSPEDLLKGIFPQIAYLSHPLVILAVAGNRQVAINANIVTAPSL
jgi:hypothetical protein